MKRAAVFVVSLIALPVYASHPHDRVCVASADLPGGDNVSFVLQYERERTYDKGDPNVDTETLTVEALHSGSDFLDMPGVRATAAPRIVVPSTKVVPLVLKDDKRVFFDGQLRLDTEALVGKITTDRGTAKITVKLSCVSQPRLVLKSASELLQ